MDRKPILFTDCLIDVTYMCEWCGTETKRAVREPSKSTRRGHNRAADRSVLSPSALKAAERRGMPPTGRPAGASHCASSQSEVAGAEDNDAEAGAGRHRLSEYGSSNCPDAKSFG